MPEVIEKEAMPFVQTERKGWVLTMTPQELVKLTPPRPPEQLSLFTDTNRPIANRHLDGIKAFIVETPDWALPNITLAATPDTLKAEGNHLTLSPQDLKILDGQHRLEAMADLINQWNFQNTDDAKKKLQALTTQDLPITIFEVQNNREQAQLFAWFARAKPIEAPVRDYFDNSDPYNQAAKAAMDNSTILKDRVNWHTRTVSTKSSDLMSLANLKEIATTINLGVTRSPKPIDRKVITQQENQKKLQDRLVEFFDNFLPTCQPNYGFLAQSQNPKTDILMSKQASHALNPLIIRLFANAWARWTDDPNHQQPITLSDHIGSLNLNLASPENDVETTLQLTNEKRKLQGLRHKSWNDATLNILKAARA